jgi:hypothetical protein
VKTAGGEASISTSGSSASALAAVIELLGIPEAVLRFALTQRTMSAGKRKSFSTIPLSKQQATDARNGLAKAVYETVFQWLVTTVNAATQPAAGVIESQPFFGILDIFGFEMLEHNGYADSRRDVRCSVCVGVYLCGCVSGTCRARVMHLVCLLDCVCPVCLRVSSLFPWADVDVVGTAASSSCVSTTRTRCCSSSSCSRCSCWSCASISDRA